MDTSITGGSDRRTLTRRVPLFHNGLPRAITINRDAGGAFQASSAAVAAVHADADATEMLFASRLLSTGYTVVQAAAGYAATDATNASTIGDLVNDIVDAVRV
jgi:hypothetical protein